MKFMRPGLSDSGSQGSSDIFDLHPGSGNSPKHDHGCNVDGSTFFKGGLSGHAYGHQPPTIDEKVEAAANPQRPASSSRKVGGWGRTWIVKVSHICVIFWTCLVLVGGRSLAEVNVGDMDGLFNTVNYNGNSKMANGDTAVLTVGTYKCSGGTCADSGKMLAIYNFNGIVKCQQDNASCILNGEQTRLVMTVDRTGASTLFLRALTFKDGAGFYGGGVYIDDGSIVTIELCVFSNCRSTYRRVAGGGAIYIQYRDNIVNVYGTTFNGNTVAGSGGDDIHNMPSYTSSSITIHNTCPSPYSSNTPIQGEI
jgi:hypothetical protein